MSQLKGMLDMTLQFIGFILVIVFGIGSFFVEKIMYAIAKQKPGERRVSIVKWICLIGTFAGAALVFLPEMIK